MPTDFVYDQLSRRLDDTRSDMRDMREDMRGMREDMAKVAEAISDTKQLEARVVSLETDRKDKRDRTFQARVAAFSPLLGIFAGLLGGLVINVVHL